ncbi:Putative auxin efflux carrier component 8 [Triticum urartu]|uniref:Putative auxin efflux carrier component 8 n=1 Tax=Triticum urartu TaxID=4572 RepID=M7Z1H8_TRIUA|nr:Putative auxin efflux carrier component 8 [Triticum urartu]
MIGWGDVYKVVSAMAPLYFALGLGYASVQWWKFFTRDQCDAVNRLVIYFALPFFAFDFNAHAGTFAAGYRVLAADAVAKLVVVLALAGWIAYCCWRHWIRAPKAPPASSASAWPGGPSWSWCITGYSLGTLNNGLFVGVPLLDAMYGKWARDIVVQLSVLQAVVWLPPAAGGVGGNPNVYASLLGVLWSSVANRWHLEMPGIVDGSISIMSRTGLGIGMFNTGLFIGLQDKLVVCRPGLTALGMAMRFVAAPAATAVGALLLGLRGDLLRVAILQAALPQSVGAFIFALEYDLHADVLSTVVIVGTLASLPVIITYYIVLGLL